MKYVHVILLLFLLNTIQFKVCSQDLFDTSQKYPLMGHWIGHWENPSMGYEKIIPKLTAEVILLDSTKYKIRILPDLMTRAEPYAEFETITLNKDKIIIDENGWEISFSEGICSGTALLYNKKTTFKLYKSQLTSPTLNLKPPADAIMLFDGSNSQKWQHADGKPITWSITTNGELETRSKFWQSQDGKKNLNGGDIETVDSYSVPLQFHMEFRYPVEPGKSGQGLGNSGLFFLPIGEVQILNSFGSNGYWNECGAIYKRFPPMVNAAAPPLQWQTYDVEIHADENSDDKIFFSLTVRLNGKLIHNQLLLPNENPDEGIKIKLQDHINRLQFRNIWVKQL
ncbi:DUF1080 domain-containing protein [Maribacter algicola]|uniref:DUF1080 domain-containing protein n=2 Tax=Maribacter algicola TaxID=2498892 RepID=A0A3R8RP12_9FLAO|nr:DUF1080 domain-containing protein [Maribacter algicola]